jgi:hypothetical protein
MANVDFDSTEKQSNSQTGQTGLVNYLQDTLGVSSLLARRAAAGFAIMMLLVAGWFVFGKILDIGQKVPQDPPELPAPVQSG